MPSSRFNKKLTLRSSDDYKSLIKIKLTRSYAEKQRYLCAPGIILQKEITPQIPRRQNNVDNRLIYTELRVHLMNSAQTLFKVDPLF